MDFRYLDTLSRPELVNGHAETIKHALIADAQLWDIIRTAAAPWENSEIINRSSNVKLRIIEGDLHDFGIRQSLNFGHTIGHAIESLTLMKHGYCVSIGILKEIMLGNLNYETINEIKNVLNNYELPTNIPNIDFNLIIDKMENDKKNNKIVTLNNIGDPKIITWNRDMILKILTYERELIYKPIDNNKYIEIMAPSSKSETNRILIMYSLGNKKYKINNILISDDTICMINALTKLGINIQLDNNSVYIHGNNGKFYSKGEINIGNSGTCMRFLTSLVGFLCVNDCVITGDSFMKQRPIDDLVSSLVNFGIKIDYLEQEGFPPIKIHGSFDDSGKDIKIKTIKSSQYVSGLLMVLVFQEADKGQNCYNNVS